MYKNTIIQEFERSLIKKNIITTVKTLDEKNKEYNITLLVTDVKSYDVSNIMFVMLSEIPLTRKCTFYCIFTVVDANDKEVYDYSVYNSKNLENNSPRFLKYICERHNNMMCFNSYKSLKEVTIEIFQFREN